MKKLLLLCSLIITFSTVQAQNEFVETKFDSNQESVDVIRSILSKATLPVSNIEAEFISMHIIEFPMFKVSVYSFKRSKTDNKVLIGFWDSDFMPEQFGTVGKSTSKDISKIDGLAIPIFAGFSTQQSESEWRKRIQNMKYFVEPHLERIPYIILMDEPFGHWNVNQLNRLYEIAKSEIDAKFGYTLREATALNEPELPQTDFLGVNYYPFRNSTWNVESKVEFDDRFDLWYNRFRNKFSGDLILVGQAFQSANDSQQWRQPPIEAVDWYIEKANQTATVLLWYQWRTRSGSWIGTEDLPELMHAILQSQE